MPNLITWGYIARHLPMITVHCDRCGRMGRYRTDKLLAKYGDTDIQQFQRDLIQDCPRDTTTIELGQDCASLVPSLRERGDGQTYRPATKLEPSCTADIPGR